MLSVTVLVPKQQLSPSSPSSQSMPLDILTFRCIRQSSLVLWLTFFSSSPASPRSKLKVVSKTLDVHTGAHNVGKIPAAHLAKDSS